MDDIDDARTVLLSYGVEASEVFHDADGGLAGGFHIGDEEGAAGHDPVRRSYASYASFDDSSDVASLGALLTRRLGQDSHEKVAPAHDWRNWYAAHMDARRTEPRTMPRGTPDRRQCST